MDLRHRDLIGLWASRGIRTAPLRWRQSHPLRRLRPRQQTGQPGPQLAPRLLDVLIDDALDGLRLVALQQVAPTKSAVPGDELIAGVAEQAKAARGLRAAVGIAGSRSRIPRLIRRPRRDLRAALAPGPTMPTRVGGRPLPAPWTDSTESPEPGPKWTESIKLDGKTWKIWKSASLAKDASHYWKRRSDFLCSQRAMCKLPSWVAATCSRIHENLA